MMKKRGRIGSALMLAVMLVASLVVVPKVQAANAVNVSADCKVDFQVSGDDFKELFDGTVKIPVKMYKVASINGSGKYGKVDGTFNSLDFSGISDQTTATEWESLAKEAQKLVTDGVEENASATITNGRATISPLATGLYLVLADKSMSAYNEYTFNPYLISLPDNRYYDTEAQTPSDEWIYELTGENALGLKPEKTPRVGSLAIVKTLKTMNITMSDKSTFVFEAVITPPSGDVYKKNVALTFDAAGEMTAVINDIPAGAKVVVTEVYWGASYELTSAPTQNATIIADERASVSFENDTDDRTNGGYGIVNNYTLRDTDGIYDYEHQQKESNTEDAQ